MSDQEIEKEIQAKGLTAPRVTLADIEAQIASSHYFTALQGATEGGMSGGMKNQVGTMTGETINSLSLLTFCVLILKSGYTVTGESACVSKENFDAELGRRIAHDNAIQKMWSLMGFALKQRLNETQ